MAVSKGHFLTRDKVHYPVPGGNKYRNLALQVRGVSKTETIKYAHEPHGTQT
jgi:hypothetical protein